MRAIGQCIGWVDDADVYLDPDAAYEVAQNMNSTGNALGIRSTTLGKRLDEQGMLVREPARDELKVRRMLGGQKRRVWQLRPGVLVAGDRDEPVGEDDVEDEDAGVEQTTAYATDAA